MPAGSVPAECHIAADLQLQVILGIELQRHQRLVAQWSGKACRVAAGSQILEPQTEFTARRATERLADKKHDLRSARRSYRHERRTGKA